MNRSWALVLVSMLVILTGLILLTPAPVPSTVFLNARLANASSEQEQPYRAIAFYQKILEYQPYNIQIPERIGIMAAEAGEDEYAAQLLTEAVSSGVISNRGLYLLGTVFYNQGNFDKAEAAWLQVPADAPEYKDTVSSLVNLYVERDEWLKSVDLLDKAYLNTDDSHYQEMAIMQQLFLSHETAIHLTKTNADLMQPEFKEIVEQFGMPGEISASQEAQNWILAGQYLEKSDQLQLAVKAYEKAIAKVPESGIPLAHLALVRQKLDLDGLKEIKQAIALDEQNPQVNWLAGLFWQNNKKPEIALIYLDKANLLDPGDQQTLLLLGNVEMELGNIKAGLDYFTEAAEVNPGDPQGWLVIAQYCLDHGVYLRERGQEAVRKAIIADEDNPASLDLAGQIYWELGDNLTGRQFLERALEQNPDYPPAQLHLGMWFLQNGDYDQGLKLIQAAATQTKDIKIRDQAQQVLDGNS